MTTDILPAIQKEKKEVGLLDVTRKEIRQHLKQNELPITKVNIRKARRKLRREKKRALPRGKDISYAQSDANFQIIYGRMKVGGIISFLYIDPTTKHLHLVLTYASHEVNAVKGLYLDDKQVTFPNGTDRWCNGDFAPLDSNGVAQSKVFMGAQNKGSTTQTANADLVGQLPTHWTSTDRQQGRAHVYLILVFHKILFAEGMPDIVLDVEGKKVYDPRNGLTQYSANSALVTADFLTNQEWGGKFDWTQIDTSNNVGGLQWAANICDENVTLASGGTEKRYEVNGIIDSGQSFQEVLEELALSMAGNVVFFEQKWRFFPAKYVAPSITLTEDDLLSAPTINRLVSKGDIFNTVRGTFVSKDNDYEVTDYAPASNSNYVTEDGQELYLDLPFNLVTSSTQCQRCAKVELEERRRQQSFVATFNLKAYELVVGETVMLNMPRYGYSNKVFVVDDWKSGFTNDLVPYVSLSLLETDSGVHGWDETQDENAVYVAPATSLPNPTDVSVPSGLSMASGTDELYKRSDGTIFSRMKVSWNEPTDVFVLESGRTQIQYKKTNVSAWSAVIEVDGDISNYHILDVQDGSAYNVRIRHINGIGSASSWVSGTHNVIGKTEKPSDVASLNAQLKEYAVSLEWQKILDLDVDRYEIRRNGNDWETATFVAEVKGTKLVDEFQTAGLHTYRVKAIDTTGNYSENETTDTVYIVAPNIVTSLKATPVDNNVLLDWEEPVPSSFPIAKYKVYKGASFSTAQLLGTVDGTFHTYIETVGGEYTYWITAVDNAGNEGTELSVTTNVFNPPDYVLQDDLQIPISDGTFTLCAKENNAIVAPIDTGVTWEDFFDDNSWNTLQDSIDAGYPIYAQPTTSGTSKFEFEKDYGAILPPSAIKLTWLKEIVSGDVTITAKIEVKENIGDAWTTYNGDTAFTIAFRYAKYTLEFTRTADTDLIRVKNLNVKIDTKKTRDGGNATSSASGWTVVTFNKDFIDVINLDVTPANASGDQLTAVAKYDWASPDTDQFEVKIFDVNGTQVAETFSWSSEGVVRPPV